MPLVGYIKHLFCCSSLCFSDKLQLFTDLDLDLDNLYCCCYINTRTLDK